MSGIAPISQTDPDSSEADLQRKLVDIEQIRSDVAVHIYSQAEARISAQVQLYSASITRSVTFSGIATALGGVFLGVGLNEFASVEASHKAMSGIEIAMLATFVGCAVLFLIGAILAFLACRSVDFNIPGNLPRSLIFNRDYIKLKNPMAWDAYNLEKPILDNHTVLMEKAHLLAIGQKFTIFATLVGIVVFVAIAFWKV